MLNAIHAKRVTIQMKDSWLARRYYSNLVVGEFDVSKRQQVDGPNAKDD